MGDIIRKSKYKILFKSDWKFEFESFRKSLKFKSLKIFYCIFILLYIVALTTIIYVYALNLHNYYLSIFWVLYLIILSIVNFIIPLKPKIYETSLRGLEINGNLYLWKNFWGYIVTNDRVYLFRSRFAVICLPRDFEEVIREFVQKKFT